jgi:GNAT superfamily N-acetyltransferase
MSAQRIDPATEADIPQVLTFIRELAEFEKRLHEVVATEALLRQHLFGARPVAEAVIARLDGRPVGFALYFHTFSTFLGKPGLYVEDVYVNPPFRSHGIGKSLFAHLARLAKSRDCGRMEWSVLVWNERAIKFYKNLGAAPLDEWTHYRLTGAALDKLAE